MLSLVRDIEQASTNTSELQVWSVLKLISNELYDVLAHSLKRPTLFLIHYNMNIDVVYLLCCKCSKLSSKYIQKLNYSTGNNFENV